MTQALTKKMREDQAGKATLSSKKIDRSHIMKIGKPAGNKNVDDRENVIQMRKLLSQAEKCRSKFGADTVDDLRLDFSQKTVIEYKNHSKVANGIIYNSNTQCFTSYNEKGIHVWNPMTGKRIFEAVFELGMTSDLSKPKSSNEACRQISCVCYSPKYYLYFACTKNFQLLIFNEYLNCIEEIPLKISLVQKCIFVDETQQLITSGSQGCFIVQLKINQIYDARKAILLNPKGDSITVELIKAEKPCVYRDYYKFQRLGKWVKGMKLDIKQRIFVCWNDTCTYFYEFRPEKPVQENVALPTVFQGLTQGQKAQMVRPVKDKHSSDDEDNDDAFLKNMQARSDADTITDILVYNPMHYFVVATSLGQLIVFKWDFANQANKNNDISNQTNEIDKPQLMNTFKGHSRSITSIKLIEGPQTSFVSASLDGTIRIWCLDKFIQLYHFQTKGCSLSTRMTSIQMLNDKIFAILSKGPNLVSIGQISHLAKSYFISTSLVSSLAKGFKNINSLGANKVDCLITTFNNNSILLLDPEKGSIRCTIYPPPTPTNIQTTLYSMALQRVFVFLQSGTFCVYKVQGRQTATLEKLLKPHELKDYEGKSLTQTISALMLGSMVPPEVDNEIFGEIFKYNPHSKGSKQKNIDPDCSEIEVSTSKSDLLSDTDGTSEHFLVMGLSKGSVIFVRVDHIEHIYARFSVHKQQIEHIQELKRQNSILTFCQENECKIWGFQDGKLAIWRKWNFYRQITTIKTVEDPINQNYSQSHIFVSFPSGEAYFFQWSNKQAGKDDPNEKNRKPDLKLVLPLEPDKWIEQSHLCEAKETPEERLQELMSNNMLINGQIEHDDEIKCIDYHCQLKLMATGDASGLIKVWNYQRHLIREILFTDPISTLSFLNARGDLIIGHKGKLSRIYAKDYLPDPELYKPPQPKDFDRILEQNSASLPDHFFYDIKQIKEQTLKLNERVIKGKTSIDQFDEDDEGADANNGLIKHLDKMFQTKPKFGMPMEEFKALLNKDDRVPELTDKRKIVKAFKAKLDIAKAAQERRDPFQPDVFENALNEAVREQQRLTRVNPKQRSDFNTIASSATVTRNYNINAEKVIGTQQSVLSSVCSELPWRQGLQPNKRPGSTNAIPARIGIQRPIHPKIGKTLDQSAFSTQGCGKSRYQLTQERIMDNIKYFNNPNPKPLMNVLLFGQQVDQQSVFSERRAVSRNAYRTKGTILNEKVHDKAISDLPMRITHNVSSASQYQIPIAQNDTINMLSSDQLGTQHKKKILLNRQLRKNLASANINVRRAEAFLSVTDSISQPEFSLGMGRKNEGQQSSTWQGTATGTESVRAFSQGGRFKFKSARGGIKNMRPVTVGMKTGRILPSFDNRIALMHGSHPNTRLNADEFILPIEEKNSHQQNQVRMGQMAGRNTTNRTSAAQSGMETGGLLSLQSRNVRSATKSSPSRGFPPGRIRKRNMIK